MSSKRNKTSYFVLKKTKNQKKKWNSILIPRDGHRLKSTTPFSEFHEIKKRACICVDQDIRLWIQEKSFSEADKHIDTGLF